MKLRLVNVLLFSSAMIKPAQTIVDMSLFIFGVSITFKKVIVTGIYCTYM